MSQKMARTLFCSLVAGLIIAGCSPISPQPTLSPLVVNSPLATPQAADSTGAAENAGTSSAQALEEAPVPDPGKASLTGILYTFTGNGPIPETGFYLMPIKSDEQGQGLLIAPQENGEDIRGRSDMQGRFALNNIPPGSYHLVVWAPYQWITAVESPAGETPLVIVLEPNQQKALDRVNVSWP